MFAESGPGLLCWMVQPVMATSPMEPPAESKRTFAVGGASLVMLLSMSQLAMWTFRTLPLRPTMPPPAQ